jgi:hypothetical protein
VFDGSVVQNTSSNTEPAVEKTTTAKSIETPKNTFSRMENGRGLKFGSLLMGRDLVASFKGRNKRKLAWQKTAKVASAP